MSRGMGLRNFIDTREQFKEYILRALGQPVIQIEMDDEQLEDAVDDALQILYDWHSEGMIQAMRKVEVTEELKNANLDVPEMKTDAEDSEAAIAEAGIPVSDDIYGVSGCLMIPSYGQNGGLFGAEFQYMLSQYDLLYSSPGNGGGSLTSIVATKQFLADVNMVVSVSPITRFSYTRRRIYLDTDWRRMSVGSWLLFECYQINDPNTHTTIWNFPSMKKLGTALAKKRWGQNLKKFSGVTMPGGVTMNGDVIYQDGEKEYQEVMSEIKNQHYQTIPAFYIG